MEITEEHQVKGIIEALLFVSSTPLTLPMLKKLLQMPETKIEKLINELVHDYDSTNRGIRIVAIAGHSSSEPGFTWEIWGLLYN